MTLIDSDGNTTSQYYIYSNNIPYNLRNILAEIISKVGGITATPEYYDGSDLPNIQQNKQLLTKIIFI